MRFSAFFVWGGRVIQEGIAVDTLLAGAGWNPAMLIQTEFGNTEMKLNRRDKMTQCRYG